jgi:hypothetical protein
LAARNPLVVGVDDFDLVVPVALRSAFKVNSCHSPLRDGGDRLGGADHLAIDHELELRRAIILITGDAHDDGVGRG